MRIHWESNGDHKVNFEHWTEYFVIKIPDGLLYAGLLIVPKGYTKIVRHSDDYDVGYYYRTTFIPIFKVLFIIQDYIER
jgi:hypothetical protein